MNPEQVEALKEHVCDLLFDVGAVGLKEGGYRLKLHETQPEAPNSPIYLSLRTEDHPKTPGPVTSGIMALIGELMGEAMNEVDFDLYTGLPEAGEPFAKEIEEIYSSRADAPKRLYMEKTEIDGKRRITGIKSNNIKPGDRVVIIDDLITQADTKLEAIAVLEAAGLEVVLVIVLVDRKQGGKEHIESAGYTVIAILDLHRMLDQYVKTGRIESHKAKEVRSYLQANRV